MLPCLRPLLLSLSLVLGAGAPAAAAALTRQPSVQSVSDSAAQVVFRTDAACAVQVRYTPEGGQEQVARGTTTGTRHAVALTGLQPATSYRYVVEACGATVSSAATFNTAPVPGTQRVHFVAMGDFGTGGSVQQQVAEAVRGWAPDLVLGLGDTAYENGTEAEVQAHLFAPMAPLLREVPMFPVAGNHEYNTRNAQPFLDSFTLPTNNPRGTERYYSFDWGHVHFVGLDSMCALGYGSAPDCTAQEQLAWLEQDLAQTQQPWKVVFFHHPVWSSGEHGSYVKLQQTLVPVLERNGVDLVLTGHDHDYERSFPMVGSSVAKDGERGIPYLVVGTGGTVLKAFATAQPAWSARRLTGSSSNGALSVTVEGGTLKGELLGPSGQVLDSFTLTKQLAAPEPSVSLQLENGRGPAPLSAFFVATSTLEAPTFQWDFGDGTQGEGARVEHRYGAPGTYVVTVTARGNGQSASAQATVEVLSTGTTVVDGGSNVVTGPGGDPLMPQEGCAAAPGLLPALGLLAVLMLRRKR